MTEPLDLRGVVSASSGGCMLTLTVTPRASKNQLEWKSDGALRVRIAAPPVDGAANNALLKFLASKLDLPQSRLTLASGEASRHKCVLALNISAEELTKRLRRALDSTR